MSLFFRRAGENETITLGILNGVILALYFVPMWTISVFKLTYGPAFFLFDTSNIATASFVTTHFSFQPDSTIRFAMLLALFKTTTVAFFLFFLGSELRGLWGGRRNNYEPLAIALAIAGLISLAGMVFAVETHEFFSLKLHATESLLIIGASIVLLVEDSCRVKAEAGRSIADGVESQHATDVHSVRA